MFVLPIKIFVFNVYIRLNSVKRNIFRQEF